MRIAGGIAEQGVEPRQHGIGDGVLKLLGLGVHLGPVHVEDVDEKSFHQAMLAQDVERDAPASVGRFTPCRG